MDTMSYAKTFKMEGSCICTKSIPPDWCGAKGGQCDSRNEYGIVDLPACDGIKDSEFRIFEQLSKQ